jgi:hypothetical protein
MSKKIGLNLDFGSDTFGNPLIQKILQN